MKSVVLLGLLLAGLCGCGGNFAYQPGANHSLATDSFTQGPHGY